MWKCFVCVVLFAVAASAAMVEPQWIGSPTVRINDSLGITPTVATINSIQFEISQFYLSDREDISVTQEFSVDTGADFTLSLIDNGWLSGEPCSHGYCSPTQISFTDGAGRYNLFSLSLSGSNSVTQGFGYLPVSGTQSTTFHLDPGTYAITHSLSVTAQSGAYPYGTLAFDSELSLADPAPSPVPEPQWIGLPVLGLLGLRKSLRTALCGYRTV